MKLQKLTIHNIASIEDAVIDFESAPLSTSEVFLITGKTGAGKSTILDAVCLALYANTPRMENTNMQGESQDGDKTVKIYDPRQLMRRNTGEAFASLTFIGSNSVHYEAIWSVARARNKVTGNIQNKKWQLTNLDTGHTLTKDKEIEAEIQAAIGLRFNQFCRTTMLAQGEFTRFLNSSDDEKAEILEKITGAGIYSKIGKKVWEVTAGKKQEWEDSKRPINDIRILTDEEVAGHKAQIKDIEKTQNRLKADREVIDKKLQWLKRSVQLETETNEAAKEYTKIVHQIQSEDFKKKELLVRQWYQTNDIRAKLNELETACKIQEEQAKRQEQAKGEFTHLRNGEQWLAARTHETKTELDSLSKKLEKDKDKAQAYDNSQAILNLFETVARHQKSIISLNEKNGIEKQKIEGEYKFRKDEADKALSKANNTLVIQENKLKAQEQELTEANLPKMREQKEVLQNKITALDIARERLAALEKEQKRRQKSMGSIAEQERTIAALKQELEVLNPQLHDAEIKEKACKDILDMQRESVENWAKNMRARLHTDDICPVCRQKIVNQIPHEEELDELFAISENRWKKENAIVSELKEKKGCIETGIKLQSRILEKAKKDFANDTSLPESEHAASIACQKCGIEMTGIHTQDTLNRLHEETTTAFNEVTEKIVAAEIKEKAAGESRRVVEKCRKEVESAKESVKRAEETICQCNERIASNKILIQSASDELDTVRKQIEDLLPGNTQWKNDWKTNMEDFAYELQHAAKEYKGNQERCQELDKEVSKQRILADQVSRTIQSIMELMPEWKEIKDSGIEEVEDLSTKASNLQTKIIHITNQIKNAKSSADEAERCLSKYYEENENMSPALLYELNSYATIRINAIGQDVADTNKELLTKQTILEQLKKQQEENEKTKPELSEEDDMERLSERISLLEKQTNELGEQKGAVNLQLQQDANNKERLKKLLADAEDKKKNYQKWSRMNLLIGDATGNKFRKIAQSYVLTSLIRSANSYMRTLTDRYTLKVTPGTFVIMLEDAYQGFASRAASTISGGEGFLVSLALALALSDIGERLSVDTLFIDEGFGTLSGEPLQNAINTLRTLHSKSGRHVGIISHVEELQERIQVQIQVIQEGNNSSSKVSIVPNPVPEAF
ncbi:MAG: AAA family ATPase [Bacteroides sp.]|nr:AAA family ATPase [Roseburia sp.]MCM1347601.1 AAA family ATPase [Bacteroides sp.]MCM1421914.1 AAA family ATPase [Bacteroides sp.]